MPDQYTVTLLFLLNKAFMASYIFCVAPRSHISGSQEVAHHSCSNAAAHPARSKLTQVHGPQMTQGPNLMRQIQSANPMRHDGVLLVQLFSGKSTAFL